MNTLFIVSVIVAFTIGLSVLVWFLTSGLRDYQLDVHRQKLFKVRNDLFDLALKNEISFEDDAYGIVRSTLNGSINFLNDLSFFRFLMFLFFSKGIDTSPIMDQYLSRRATSFQKLDQTKRVIYENAISDMHSIIISFMIKSSILLSLTIRIVAFFISLSSLTQFITSNSQVKRRFEVLDTEANALATA